VTLAGRSVFRGVRAFSSRIGLGAIRVFRRLGQHPLLGRWTLSIIIFAILFAVIAVVLHGSALGPARLTVGTAGAARLFRRPHKRVKMDLFVARASSAALAGSLMQPVSDPFAATCARVELDIITIVLSRVSMFGGSGIWWGGLSISSSQPPQRNGLPTSPQHPDERDRGLLILSVLVSNHGQLIHNRWRGSRDMKKIALRVRPLAICVPPQVASAAEVPRRGSEDGPVA